MNNKIVSFTQFPWSDCSLPLVTTNGCFDLIHRGHIELLRKAKTFGGTLVVLLNSDESVKRIKGDSRPHVDQASRAEIVAAFEFVDYVTIFNDDIPYVPLNIIKPDIHVKGGDYDIEHLPERAVIEKNGGIVEIVPLFKGFSTTSLIESIFDSHGAISLNDISEVVEIDDNHDWGREHRLINNEYYCTKFLEYTSDLPGSLHSHTKKHETFKILKGEVYVMRLYKPGESIDMPQGTEHQMIAKSSHAVIVEASTHHDDSDTFRLDYRFVKDERSSTVVTLGLAGKDGRICVPVGRSGDGYTCEEYDSFDEAIEAAVKPNCDRDSEEVEQSGEVTQSKELAERYGRHGEEEVEQNDEPSECARDKEADERIERAFIQHQVAESKIAGEARLAHDQVFISAYKERFKEVEQSGNEKSDIPG